MGSQINKCINKIAVVYFCDAKKWTIDKINLKLIMLKEACLQEKKRIVNVGLWAPQHTQGQHTSDAYSIYTNLTPSTEWAEF